ncbi:hypothetical protein H4R21_001337 [Coemansia helicoidea]|uniref:Uncharacterized protein n=1 Tax=Coemansia helicoidea TaxID=1286919 RepID=A0ACC1LD65_9FUNG|nr:hypothetical protein H4R21_001337 [Coemansia helicoidea]
MRTQTRLMKEARMLQSELPPGIVCTPREESLDRYQAQIDGPPDTPYERGRFAVDVALSDRYPMEPPSVRFATRIYHPNIDDHGNICLDVLKSGKSGCWNPSWTLAKVLVALSVLLATPNPHDPLMPEIADLLLNDRPAYLAAARDWTARFATPAADGSEGPAESPAKRRRVDGTAASLPPAPAPPQQKPPLVADRPPALPATGIRRLGLSRSRNAVAKSLPPASQSSQGSSQPESIDVTSDDSAATACHRPLQRRTRNAKLSQILGQSKPRRTAPGRLGAAAAQHSQEPIVEEEPGDDDDNDDAFECLLESADSSSANEPDSTPPAVADNAASPVEDSAPATQDSGPLTPADPVVPAADVEPDATDPVPPAADSEPEPPAAAMDPEPPAPAEPHPQPMPMVVAAADDRPPERKSKGKGVDRAPPPAQATVLHESHFGPLDLGLPPVRVSAQRRLLRRAREPAD